MSFAVLLFFFGLLAYMFLTNTTGRFLTLVMGTVLFPTTALIIKNPSISPQHLFLYTFFFIEFFKDRQNFNRSVSSNLLLIPIAISILSYTFTAIYNAGIASKDMYYGLRDVVDCFGYIYAAFICGQKEDIYKIAQKLIPFVITVCLFGIVEVLLGDNYPYKLIHSAFPYYEGDFDLNSTVSFIEHWRFRTCFTTKHPTAFGTLLMSLFLFYFPYIMKKGQERKKIILMLALLALNLYLCGSRTAMLCSAFGVGLFFYFKLKPFLKIVIAGCVIFAFSTVLAILVQNFQTNADRGSGSNLDFRTAQLLYSVAAIYNSPIFGNGNKYTSHVIFAEDARASDSSGRDLGGLESIVFSLLIDRGFFGLFSHYLLLLWMFILLFHYRNRLKGISGGFALMAGGILFLTLSGTIGNSSSFIFLFTGLQLGYISQYKRIAYENNTEVSDEIEIETSGNEPEETEPEETENSLPDT